MNSVSGASLADLRDRRRDGAVRVDPHVVRRHQTAGGIVVVLDQLAQLARRSPRSISASSSCLLLFGQFAEQVGGVVGVHLLDDVGGALVPEVLDDRRCVFGVEMLEGVGGGLVVERVARRAPRRAPRDR